MKYGHLFMAWFPKYFSHNMATIYIAQASSILYISIYMAFCDTHFVSDFFHIQVRAQNLN